MTLSIILILAIPIVYIFVLRPRIKAYRRAAGIIEALDARGLSIIQRVRLHLAGLKTVILASAAAAVGLLPSALDQLAAFTGWDAFFEQSLANKIAACLSLLSACTRVFGGESPAKMEPKED